MIPLLLIVFLIIIGSVLLFIAIFGSGTLFFKGSNKLEKFRTKYNTLMLTSGVLLILAAFTIIISPSNNPYNKWTDVQKEEMIKKIMESSIFVHGIGTDTVRLVSECFISKYTSIYTPQQMREQNKMSNEEISKFTSYIMIECLKKYGLPQIDSTRNK